MALTLNDYQDRAYTTARYPAMGNNLLYPALKLNGEAGEVAEKVGKLWRDGNLDEMGPGLDEETWYVEIPESKHLTVEQHEALLKELGDVLWYVAALATEMGVSLEDVARINLEKLAGRKARGTLHGSGDDR